MWTMDAFWLLCGSTLIVGCSSTSSPTAAHEADAGPSDAAVPDEIPDATTEVPTSEVPDVESPDGGADRVESGADVATTDAGDAGADGGSRCPEGPPCQLGEACLDSIDCATGLQCIGGRCLECAPGATRCSGNRSATCTGGLWVVAASDCPSGCISSTGLCRTCASSTCTSVKVIFHGAVSSQSDVELAVDDGTVAKTTNAADPSLGQKNLLYGNFTSDLTQYTTDNTACGLPNFGPRTNMYYLAQMKGLAVASSWYSNPVTFHDDQYCQSCPNFGCDNFISTPKQIERIELQAYDGDLTCKVCLYIATTPSAASLLRCVSPNTTISVVGLDAAATYPLLLRVDDGSSCGSY